MPSVFPIHRGFAAMTASFSWSVRPSHQAFWSAALPPFGGEQVPAAGAAAARRSRGQGAVAAVDAAAGREQQGLGELGVGVRGVAQRLLDPVGDLVAGGLPVRDHVLVGVAGGVADPSGRGVDAEPLAACVVEGVLQLRARDGQRRTPGVQRGGHRTDLGDEVGEPVRRLSWVVRARLAEPLLQVVGGRPASSSSCRSTSVRRRATRPSATGSRSAGRQARTVEMVVTAGSLGPEARGAKLVAATSSVPSYDAALASSRCRWARASSTQPANRVCQEPLSVLRAPALALPGGIVDRVEQAVRGSPVHAVGSRADLRRGLPEPAGHHLDVAHASPVCSSVLLS